MYLRIPAENANNTVGWVRRTWKNHATICETNTFSCCTSSHCQISGKKWVKVTANWWQQSGVYSLTLSQDANKIVQLSILPVGIFPANFSFWTSKLECLVEVQLPTVMDRQNRENEVNVSWFLCWFLSGERHRIFNLSEKNINKRAEIYEKGSRKISKKGKSKQQRKRKKSETKKNCVKWKFTINVG